jgi:hypothetical protein
MIRERAGKINLAAKEAMDAVKAIFVFFFSLQNHEILLSCFKLSCFSNINFEDVKGA